MDPTEHELSLQIFFPLLAGEGKGEVRKKLVVGQTSLSDCRRKKSR